MAVLDSGIYKWRQVVKGAQIASQIGHCNSPDSFKKQQNLQKAIEEAKRLVAKSPEFASRATTPVYLPDMTGSDIFDLVRGEQRHDSEPGPTKKRITLSPNVTLRKYQASPITPSITIDPPNKLSSLKRQTAFASVTQTETPDLINLDSTKSSPVASTKKSPNYPSSNSLNQTRNTADTESPDKILTSPVVMLPLPEDNLDSQSKDYLKSRVTTFIDSSDSSEIKSDEELKDVDHSLNVVSADESLEGAIEKSNEIKEKIFAKETKSEIGETSAEVEAEFSVGMEESWVEVESAVEARIEEEKVELEETVSEIEYLEVKSEVEVTETKADEGTSVSTSKLEDSAAASSDSSTPPKNPTLLVQRNLQRIRDSKVDLPKYSWL